nr:pentapeptide repeat-containing protein [uncultured Selenomonas sp.]
MDKRELSMDEVRHILKEHKLWVDTNHQSGAQADFSNCDLRRFDFCYGKRGELHKFHSMNFRGTDFSGVSFERLHFKGCDFTDAKLNNTHIVGVCFDGCNFLNTKVTQASLFVCRINQCNMQNTLLGDSKLIYCQFFDNSFREANLNRVSAEKGCHIEGNTFSAVNPVCTDFSNAIFIDNKFFNATFISCTFDLTQFKNCEFKQSGFLDSYVEQCRFQQSDLQNRFMQVSFPNLKGDTIHLACDLGLRTVISRDLFDDKLPVRVDEFLKEALAIPARDKK